MNEFPMNLKLRLDWSELDIFGHVNNIAFFKHVQSSRVNLWGAVSLWEYFEKYRVGPILVSCKCEFRKPLFYPGNIKIRARVEFVKNTSFGVHHQIIDEHGDVAAEAHDVIVMYDFDQSKKYPFPEDVKEKLDSLKSH